jgi:LysR family hydrogen peroxide-inducible transcriptional activator
MVGAGMGVTLIPEMAVAVETRSASVSVARFDDPEPSRTVGMIWRKITPLAGLLLRLSELICNSADELHEQHKRGSSRRNPRTRRDAEAGYSIKRAARRKKPSVFRES